ncbi:Trypanosomal VSG domain containing protein, putative [Trypanosoma equiperdum]|uniref:Trypanosomal VSG domain containing protein, putative n=1 Tax=Trypanosoma equiperdum TaxID=5694 RepID=A0A1G4I0G9_TRYEQ|nr:Trypanosomal VSG domain containing protein, putative [Trypanosoma equiperdum]
MIGVPKALFLVIAARPSMPAANGNAPELKTMCEIYQLAASQGDITTINSEPNVESNMEQLKTLNLTVESDAWLEDKEGALADKDGTKKEDARKEWQTEKLKLDKTPADGKDHKFRMVPNHSHRPTVAAAIKRALEAALNLKDQYDLISARQKAAPSEIKKALTEALYGTGDTKLTGTIMTSTAKNYCSTTNGHAATVTGIAYNFLCLCSSTDQADTVECAHGITGNQLSDPTSGTNAQTALTATIQKCPKNVGKNDLTAQRITTVISAFLSLLGAASKGVTDAPVSFIYGKAHTNGDFNAKSGQGNCVNYKQQLTGSVTVIPWIRKLEDAQQKLLNQVADETAMRTIAAKIETLTTTAWSVHDQALLTPDVAATTKPSATELSTRTEADTTCKKKGKR